MSSVEVYKQFKGKYIESFKESWSSVKILFTDGTWVVVTAVKGPMVNIWVEDGEYVK